MSKYLDNLVTAMTALQQQANDEPNPRHQKILRNYIRHMSLETAGLWDQFLDDHDTMMSDDIVYHVRSASLGAPDLVTVAGHDAVHEFYSGLGLSMGVLQSQDTAVSDWGFSSWLHHTHFFPGRDVPENFAHHVTDPDALYALENIRFGMYWPYDDQQRLIGEDLFEVQGPERVVEVAPEDRFEKSQLAGILEPFFAG
jgi:hypothetical protein